MTNTQNQKDSRFLLLNSIDTYKLKDRLNSVWYQFDTEEERTTKIKELEDEQSKKTV